MVSDYRSFMSILLLSILGFCFLSSQAYTFYVGGPDGWVLQPKEDYNHWASRNRFQVNDTLVFEYKPGNDAVLQVDNDDYFSCNKEKPLLALRDGFSKFKLNKPGYFFFISGHADSCAKGQRITILVLHPKKPLPLVVLDTPAPAPGVFSEKYIPAPAPKVFFDEYTPTPAPSLAASSIPIVDGLMLGFSIFIALATLGYML